MRIAITASEGAPYIKSGGLGDVMEALPSALSRIEGNEVALFLPYYGKIRNNPAYKTELVSQFYVSLGWRQQYAGVLRLLDRTDGVQVYFIDNLYYFGGRDSAIYGDGDDGERFAFFSKACLDAMVSMAFIPDVIQCNDWQTAALPVFLSAQYAPLFPGTKCMFTIHNIEYQGWADGYFFDDVLSLPQAYRSLVDMNGAVNMMKGAIETAHMVTTVSESYAKELMYPYYAHGLDGVIATSGWKLTGITNGIDTNTFNPATDPALPAHYTKTTLKKGKALCKAALQEEVGLPQKADSPLLVMVTRLVGHKGLDLLCYAIEDLLASEDFQLLILGTGEKKFEDFFLNLAAKYPDRVSAKITFNLGLAARIYAGGDIYLMPSKSEPCGLSQMNAMRYGTVPVVHATGGLRDTVPGADENGKGGLGFTFQSYNGDDFRGAVVNCLNLYHNQPTAFRALQKLDMSQDFSWDKPAQRYMELFTKMCNN